MSYLSPEGERMVMELLAIMLFIPVVRIVVGVIGILGLFDAIERDNRRR